MADALYVYRNTHTKQTVYLATPDFAGNADWQLVSGPGSSTVTINPAANLPITGGHSALFNTTDTAGGTGVVALATAAVEPTGVPVGGGVLYIDADGALHYVSPSGANTVLATS